MYFEYFETPRIRSSMRLKTVPIPNEMSTSDGKDSD
jgi:hypothetical protein